MINKGFALRENNVVILAREWVITIEIDDCIFHNYLFNGCSFMWKNVQQYRRIVFKMKSLFQIAKELFKLSCQTE